MKKMVMQAFEHMQPYLGFRHAALLFSFFFSYAALAQQCTFDNDDECWATFGDATSLTHLSAGGNPGGYMRATDLNQGVPWGWVAPAYFLGDKLASLGHYLRFDRKTTQPGGPSANDVLIQGNGINLHAQCPGGVSTVWSTCSLQLDPSVWMYSGTTNNVSNADLQLLLANVTYLQILAEYSTSLDVGSIDNVILEPASMAIDSPGSLCSGSSIDFNGAAVINPTTWLWQFDGGVPSSSTVQSPQGILYDNPGAWSVSLTITHECQSDTISEMINVGEVNVFPTWMTNVNATICDGADYELPNGSFVSVPGSYQVVLSSMNGCDSTVTTALSLAPQYSLLDTVFICSGSSYPFNSQQLTLPGSYEATWSSIAGCDSTVLLTLEIYPPLEASTTVFDNSCPGDSSGSLIVTVAGGVSPYIIGLANGTTSTSGSFTGLAAGIYLFTVTDASGCSQTSSAAIGEPMPIVLDVSPDAAIIDIGQSQALSVTSNYHIDSVQWSPQYGLSCTDCMNPIFTGDTTSYLTIEALVNVNGTPCAFTVQDSIRVRPRFFVPNAFIPDGDGANDVFSIVGLNLKSLISFELRVFDRWGREVYVSINPFEAWKGDEAPVGVYAWAIRYKQSGIAAVKDIKGHVALIR